MSNEIPKLFKTSEANKIHNIIGESKGEFKNRFNISKALLKEDYNSDRDLTNQFLIATEGDALHTTRDKNWTAGFGKVAVLIDTAEIDGESPEYTYVILNIESLGKRLLMNRSELRQLEENAEELKTAVTNKLKDLIEQEKEVTEAIEFLQDGVTPADGGEFDDYRKRLVDFIEIHFKDDPYLMENLSIFKNNLEALIDDSDYLNHLKTKLWWKIGDTQLEKVAITLENLPNVLYGETGRAVLNLLPGELSKGRYSLELKHDFIFASRPEKFEKDEAPFYSGNGWVIVSVKSLACLGMSEDEVKDRFKTAVSRERVDRTLLDDEISARIESLKSLNNKMYNGTTSILDFIEVLKYDNKTDFEIKKRVFEETRALRTELLRFSAIHPDAEVRRKLETSQFLINGAKTVEKEIENLEKLNLELINMKAITGHAINEDNFQAVDI
ncbi:MAG: hypothetical protein H0T62_02280 [Parachlamydiaceae bacterium]|nr:hypothetical protein [Parachlamydiaceae bacterium]